METPPEFDHERVFSLCCHTAQDGLLRKRMLEFLMSEDMSLGDCFEGIHIRAVFVAHKEYLSRTSFAKHTHHLEVGHLHLAGDAFLDGRLGAFLADATLA